ncbi:MAG: hypothetical protein ACYSOW_11295 [Planctomycetota bacterium]
MQQIYKMLTFGPAQWISIVAVAGLVSIALGELLRRRNYEIVAKGIAALGFALLYAAL